MTVPYTDLNTVHTPSSGGIPPVAWGSDIRANLELLSKMPGCSVRRSTALAVVTSTITDVPFTASDVRDTDAYHDTSTNPNRMTVPTGLGGVYRLTAYIDWAANATGFRQMGYTINGGTAVTRQAINTTLAGIPTQTGFTVEVPLNAGDYITVWGFQNSGGNLNIADADATLTMAAVA